MRLAVFLFVGLLSFANRAWGQSPNAGDYVWASACKTCHAPEYAAWDQTKHARTIAKLSAAERDSACAACHVTAGDRVMDADVNANVQCERCHGSGKVHIEAAASGAAKPGAIVANPSEAACRSCHSEKSPHFKFFSYAAMRPLVHQTKK